mmetsp:Transcript_26303/g.60584  ORF Transcript_26303/g.60584 Transcript_26303/m.60584 type:complete len:232 (+) Transcript_26303:388-1083(+)
MKPQLIDHLTKAIWVLIDKYYITVSIFLQLLDAAHHRGQCPRTSDAYLFEIVSSEQKDLGSSELMFFQFPNHIVRKISSFRCPFQNLLRVPFFNGRKISVLSPERIMELFRQNGLLELTQSRASNLHALTSNVESNDIFRFSFHEGLDEWFLKLERTNLPLQFIFCCDPCLFFFFDRRFDTGWEIVERKRWPFFSIFRRSDNFFIATVSETFVGSNTKYFYFGNGESPPPS